MRYLIIPADVSKPSIEVLLAGDLTLEAAHKIVGGYIEHAPLPSGTKLFILVNEEGKLNNLPVNIRATAGWYMLWRMTSCVPAATLMANVLVGDVIVTGMKETEDGPVRGDVPEVLKQVWIDLGLL